DGNHGGGDVIIRIQVGGAGGHARRVSKRAGEVGLDDEGERGGGVLGEGGDGPGDNAAAIGHIALGGRAGDVGHARGQGVGNDDIGGGRGAVIGQSEGVGQVARHDDRCGGRGHGQTDVGGGQDHTGEGEVEGPPVGDDAGIPLRVINDIERPVAVGVNAVKGRQVGVVGRGRGQGRREG